MLRLSEIALPLNHAESALPAAIVAKLGIAASELIRYNVAKRAVDARRKSNIQLIYNLDITLDPAAEDRLLAERNPHVRPAPDTRYKFVAQAPEHLAERPVVVGLGPCGIFIALVLAQMGFKPIVLERGKNVRERTKDTWGLWRKKVL
ncbi:MAG TPA: hypothetical protein PK011_16290, partial [Marinagarivorans sp.]|nr:hypothetical protein [Marinagarivorans sp.]